MITRSDYVASVGYSKGISDDKIDNRDFMNGDNELRSRSKVYEDNLKGKLAEFVVARRIEVETGYPCEVDCEIYPLGIGDDFDLTPNRACIDVKASSPRARYLLVERARVESWRAKGSRPYLCMVSIDLAEREGHYMFGTDYRAFMTKALHLRRGECIPGTSMKLKADNYALHRDQCKPFIHLAAMVVFGPVMKKRVLM